MLNFNKFLNVNYMVILFFIILVIVDCLFCICVGYNQIKPEIFYEDEFELSYNNDIAEITSISSENSYININGILKKDIKIYEVYIATKDKDNKIKGFKTKWDNSNNSNIFFSKIKKKYLEKNTCLYIIYKCDNKNILIKTNSIIGEEI